MRHVHGSHSIINLCDFLLKVVGIEGIDFLESLDSVMQRDSRRHGVLSRQGTS